MTLTSVQRRHLRSLAHHLKPVVLLGQRGLSNNVLTEIDIALDAHELIKVRMHNTDRDACSTLLQVICHRCNAENVQQIGRVCVLFRRNPKKPRVIL